MDFFKDYEKLLYIFEYKDKWGGFNLASVLGTDNNNEKLGGGKESNSFENITNEFITNISNIYKTIGFYRGDYYCNRVLKNENQKFNDLKYTELEKAAFNEGALGSLYFQNNFFDIYKSNALNDLFVSQNKSIDMQSFYESAAFKSVMQNMFDSSYSYLSENTKSLNEYRSALESSTGMYSKENEKNSGLMSFFKVFENGGGKTNFFEYISEQKFDKSKCSFDCFDSSEDKITDNFYRNFGNLYTEKYFDKRSFQEGFEGLNKNVSYRNNIEYGNSFLRALENSVNILNKNDYADIWRFQEEESDKQSIVNMILGSINREGNYFDERNYSDISSIGERESNIFGEKNTSEELYTYNQNVSEENNIIYNKNIDAFYSSTEYLKEDILESIKAELLTGLCGAEGVYLV